MLLRERDVRKGALLYHHQGTLFEVLRVRLDPCSDRMLVAYHPAGCDGELYWVRPLTWFMSLTRRGTPMFRRVRVAAMPEFARLCRPPDAPRIVADMQGGGICADIGVRGVASGFL